MIYPYLLYGIIIWGDAASVHLEPLILIQKRIIRTITFSEFLAPTKPLFVKTKILPVPYIYKFVLGIFMYKQNVNSQLTNSTHQYETRNSSNVVPNFQRLSQCQRSVGYNGPKCWNDIPSSIKNCKSLASFKKIQNISIVALCIIVYLIYCT